MTPRVTLSNIGLGWGHEAARAAHESGLLTRYIVGVHDPARHGVPAGLIRLIKLPNYAGFAIQQISTAGSIYLSYRIRDRWFDHAASRVIPAETTVFHGFNHMSLTSMRKAHGLGAKTIVDRASAHAVTQDRLLREEFARFDAPYPASASALVTRHVQEYDKADLIVVASVFIERTMLEQGTPADKLRVLPLGFDPGKFQPGPPPDGRFRVIFVGLIGVRKGVHYLLEAFKRLALPDAELVLVGGLSSDARLFLDAYRGVYTHIPFVDQAQLADLYHSASAFVLPSVEEGFGMVVVEAAASGLPVIISENVGAVIRDGVDGYVVPVRDVEALAARIETLYRDRDLARRMGQSAHEYVQQYTWDRYHRGLIEIYEELG